MNRATRLDPAPGGVTTLDLLLFTAGFACGWMMHQGSDLRRGVLHPAAFARQLPLAPGHVMGRMALGMCNRAGVLGCRSAASIRLPASSC